VDWKRYALYSVNITVALVLAIVLVLKLTGLIGLSH
jgi:hypothetical protein